MRSRFFKLSGGGNDFIALVEPGETPSAASIRTLCRRGISLGADGLMTLHREPELVRMRYWNGDGSEASLCLNGARCAAALAFHLGWATDSVICHTGAGRLAASAAGRHRVAIEVPLVDDEPESATIEVASGAFTGWRVTVGVPHFVLFPSADLAALPVEVIGRELRLAPEFAPAGANVHFARLTAPDAFDLRSYERGVEAETLACGSGVLAVVAAALASGELRLPARAGTRGGFVFDVAGTVDAGRVTSWTLTGDARVLAAGELEPGAFIAPS